MTGRQSRPSPAPPSLSFNDCKLTPSGVNAMTAHLRALPLLQTIPEARVRAAAIALITFGGSSLGADPVRRADPGLHSGSSDWDWQDELGDEYMRMLMDMLTSHDRASGGVSFLISTPGTCRSGAPPIITEVKMDVFLPIVLFGEQPHTRIAFARMVQYFAEEIGLPAMQRLTRAKSSKPPKVLTIAADVIPRLNTHVLFPSSNTPWHILYGRDIGVLERLITEQIVVAGAAPEMSPITPRLLPSLFPEVFAPPAQSPSILHFGKGKQVEDRPWTVDDVRRYAEQFESCGGNDAGRRTIVQQVSTRLPELFGIVVNLARRVDELEVSKQTHLFEIQSLRQALQHSSDRRHVDMTRIVMEKAAPSVPETTRRSSHRSEIEDTSMFRLGCSGSSKSGNPMSSLIPSVAMPPSHPSTYDTRRGESGLSLGGGKIFGPSTDVLLARHRLPRRTHTILRAVEKNYSMENWMQELRVNVEGCSDDVAETLVEAMKADRQMTTRNQPSFSGAK